MSPARPGGARRPGPRRRRPPAVVVAGLAAAVTLAPGLVTPVAAAWTDTEVVAAPVRLASADCTDTGLYVASAAAALLAGTVQGVAVGGSAATAPLTAGPRRDAVALSSPFTTAAAGATPVVSGTALPLVLTAGGSWGRAATTSGTGASSAAVTGATPLGTVDVSGLLARTPAATALLPGLSGVGLAVGAPTASAAKDGCAAGWGATGTLVRSSTLSALSLRYSASAITAGFASLRVDGAAAGTALGGTAAAAGAPVGSAAGEALRAALAQVLGATVTVGPATSSATITPSVAAIPDAVSGQWTSGSTTLDGTSGSGTLDLLPSGTSGAGPDVETVTAPVMSGAAASIGPALRTAAGAVATATTSARDAAPVAATASVRVLVGASPLLDATLTASAPRADGWAAGSAAPAVNVAVTVLSPQLLALPSNLPALLTAALGTLPTVGAALSREYLAKAPSPAATLTADADAAAAAAAPQLAAVPTVLSAVVGQRATSAASSWTGSLASGVSANSALRVRVRDATGTRMDLFVGSTAVGPDVPAAR